MNISNIISIFCLAFCLFFFFFFKWYIKRRTSMLENLAAYRGEVNGLIAGIDAATDRDSLLIEDRIKKLKEILEETDKRIAVYVRELDRSRTGEALYTSLGRGIRAALKTPVESAPAQNSSASARNAMQEVEPVTVQPPVPQSPPAEPYHTPQKPPLKKQIRVQIETLVNEGVSPAEIASRLDISLAEVDLALNLINRHTNRGLSH